MESSKKKEMPTIKEIMRAVGSYRESCSWGQSRSVLNNLDKPVLAFGVGFAGAVIVFADGHNRPRGTLYTVRDALDASARWGGFASLGVDKALETIKTNRYLVDKATDEERIRELEEKYNKTHPLVGTVKFRSVSPWNNTDVKVQTLRVHLNKQKNYYSYLDRTYGTVKFGPAETAKGIVKIFRNGNPDEYDYDFKKPEVISSDIKEEDIEKMQLYFNARYI